MGGSWELLMTLFWGIPASLPDPPEPEDLEWELIKVSIGGALRAMGCHEEAQRGAVTCPRSQSTAARWAPSPGTTGWSKGVVKEKEGEELRLPGRERFLTSGDHVIGRDAGPRSLRPRPS